jgi:ubiquinone/menaquinone biosynthesis C-methylase UbiE
MIAFEWERLPKGSKVVDVGGGIGNVLFPVAEHFPDLKLIIQDLPAVVENGKKVTHKLSYMTFKDTKYGSFRLDMVGANACGDRVWASPARG